METRAERPEPVPEGRTLPARPARRRVRANAVAANVARFDAGIAARDIDAIDALLTDDYELVDHPNGIAYGRGAVLDYLAAMYRAKGLRFGHELVATLGTSRRMSAMMLATCRGCVR